MLTTSYINMKTSTEITLSKRGNTYYAIITILGTVETVPTSVNLKRFAAKIAEDKLTRSLEQSDKVWRVKYLVSEFVRNAFHVWLKTAKASLFYHDVLHYC